VAWGICAFVVLSLATAIAFWMHARWATAYVRAAGATVWRSPKGWYIITLAKDKEAKSVLNADLKRLNSLDDNIWLIMDNTDAADQDLFYLADLEKLTFLGLANTRITDGGVPQLANLHHLGYLDLRGTNVTDSGVKALRKVLPACAIER